tara:strand:+ start:1026 stop:2543 length:1518 start_codon:yes stop_codon:yes gene_type:complete
MSPTPLPLLSILIWTPIVVGFLMLFFNKGDNRYTRFYSILTSILMVILSIILLTNFDFNKHTLQFVENNPWIDNFKINYFVAIDGLSLLFILLTSIISLLILFFSLSDTRPQENKFFSLFLILEGLLFGVFCSFDSILFYIFFESMLIPLFLIIGIWGGPNRIYATIKFFLYTLFGSVLMLVAIIYLSFKANSFEIFDFYNLILPLQTQIFIFIAFLIAFGIKIPMWPVHTWLPDAHVEAPTGGSVILAAVILKVGGYGMIRFLLPITTEAGMYLYEFLIPLSLIAIIYISFVALAQQDMKKLIAYSSVAHMGFVTLGIFLVFAFLDNADKNMDIANLALQGAVIQMISHGLISAALFICIGIIYTRTKSRLINEQSGVVKVMPVFSTFMIFFLLANSGLPGTSGFVGEFLVLVASMGSNIVYAILASFTLVLAASYSLWLGKRVIFGVPSNQRIISMKEIQSIEFWTLLVLLILVLIIGIKPDLIMYIMHETSHNIVYSLVRGI